MIYAVEYFNSLLLNCVHRERPTVSSLLPERKVAATSGTDVLTYKDFWSLFDEAVQSNKKQPKVLVDSTAPLASFLIFKQRCGF